jgi:hypothetical protein
LKTSFPALGLTMCTILEVFFSWLRLSSTK